jgi:hypothetical protein
MESMMKYLNVLNLLFITAIGVTLVGCDASVTDFVKSARPSNIPAPNIPTDPVNPISNGANQFKISPSKINSKSANASLTANITPTRQVLSSANVGIEVGINRSRASQ